MSSRSRSRARTIGGNANVEARNIDTRLAITAARARGGRKRRSKKIRGGGKSDEGEDGGGEARGGAATPFEWGTGTRVSGSSALAGGYLPPKIRVIENRLFLFSLSASVDIGSTTAHLSIIFVIGFSILAGVFSRLFFLLFFFVT